MPMFGRAVWRQARMIMVTLRLTEVVIAHAVQEDHQHGPRNEEQDGRREWIDQHADPQPGIPCWKPGIPCWKPGNGLREWMFAEMFNTDRFEKHDHRAQPGK